MMRSSTSLICGELHFSSNTMHPLSHALPACFVVRAAHADQRVPRLSSMMVDVTNSGLAGRQVLLNKLADTLFTLAICDYAQRQTDHRGLFRRTGRHAHLQGAASRARKSWPRMDHAMHGIARLHVALRIRRALCATDEESHRCNTSRNGA
jgi:hypothetical protein